ncbi:putative ribonuclease H-like domain-containing protein [Tanacetum coccineum]
MPPRPDLSFAGLDDYVFKSKVSETITSVPCASKTSKDSLEKPKTVRSFNHLIKDCDFHDNKMVEKPVLNKKGRVTGQRDIRPVWNNAQRVNHQNKLTHPHSKMNFVPAIVLTKSGQVPVNAAKQSSYRVAVLVSAARRVNIVAPKSNVNDALPTTYSYLKAHSPVRMAFNLKSAAKTYNFKEKVNNARFNNVTTVGPKAVVSAAKGNRNNADQGIFDSGCSKHMTGNKFYLSDYQDIDGGFVAFGGSSKGGVLFTKTECLVLSPDFKLLDESQVLLKVPRQNNMYSFDLKNVVPSGDLTCLFAKATIDESNLWYRRLGHINFKTINKLVRGNLVRGFPSKLFENDHTCVAYQKGKQHKASYKTKLVSSISHLLQMLHMDLFGPTFVKSLNKKMYCLVVTGDFSRFSWVFFLASKDETSGILKTFFTGIENQINNRVKMIRYDNRTEFKNTEMNQFCHMKRIKREFSVSRTPQQNGVAERKNKTLIEEVRTMLAVLVTNPHNKIPYELLIGRTPNLDFMRPFGCLLTILNTLDHLGKFEGKADEGFLVGYVNSKAFRVFNTRTGKVEENLHVKFLENKSNVAGSGTKWLFDIDSLTKSMNYEPVTTGNKTSGNACIETNVNAGQARQEKASDHEYILVPFMPSNTPLSLSIQSSDDKDTDEVPGKGEDTVNKLSGSDDQERTGSSTKDVNTVGPSINTANANINTGSLNINTASHIPNDPSITSLKETGIFDGAYDDEDVGAEADLNNLETTMNVWRLVDLPIGKHVIGTKWVYRNKKDESGIVVRNKERLVAQVKTTSILIETNKALLKDEEAKNVDVYLYISIIGSLMYLTASRPDITFAVCNCARFQVTPKVLHLHTVKRIFRYLKGQSILGLWYPRDSPFDLKAFSDSDYARASLDRKSTTGGCQFLSKRLISWQCKKHTIVSNSTTKAEYVAATNCYGQHIEIRHHFIRDSYEKKLIEVIKIHTDQNVVDLLTKAFDVSRPPSISFMRPFGCPMTILNTLDLLGKFNGKADEGFFVGYSINSKAFRVFNTRTRKVEENLHITFLENKPNVAGSGPDWLFDIDLLTNSMNYEPVTAGNQTNRNAGIKDNVDAVPIQQYIMLLVHRGQRMQLLMMLVKRLMKNQQMRVKEMVKRRMEELQIKKKEGYANSTNRVSTASLSVSAIGQSFNNANDLPTDPLMPDLEDTVNLLNTGIFSGAYDDRKDEGVIRMIERGRSLETRKMKRNLVRNQGKIWSAQGLHPREGIDYDEVFSAVAWIEAISDDAQEIPDEFYRGAHFLLRVAASRPDIMFVVCACARFQVTPKVSHLHAVKRIFRYLKGQDLFALVFEISPFDLEAFSNSDYARASLERKNPQ